MLDPKTIAYNVTRALDEKKGMDIKLLKIDRVSPCTCVRIAAAF